MNKRKLLTLALTVAMIAILAIGGTLAYFTDTSSATNVMTLGGVEIVQNEQQRDEDGELVDFVQNKPLMPRVDTVEIEFGKNHMDETNQWFNPAMNNVVDKVITVTNTAEEGADNKDAYVRTILAFETNNEYEEGTPNVRRDAVEIFDTYFGVLGKGIVYTDIVIELGEGDEAVKYIIAYKVYEDALTPGQTSEPSLKQIFMSPEANNEISKLFGDTYEILALSQGTQTAGFANAEEALNTAFGEINAENVTAWMANVEE